MSQTLQFLLSLKKLNSIFLNIENKEEFKRNIQHLMNSNEEIKNLPQPDEQKKMLFLKTIRIINIDWLDIAQSIDNIRELIDYKLNNS